MDRSQLRLLARRFATGAIDAASYRRERRMLIDSIVNGDVEIERQPSPAPVVRPPAEPAPTAIPSPPGNALSLPSVLVGLVVLGVVIWLLYPSQTATPVYTPSTTVEIRVTRDAPGPGERIVEEFLGNKDWSEISLSNFDAAWTALTDVERTEAREAGTLQHLIDAMAAKLDSRQAVYDLKPNSDNWDALSSLYMLGERIGASSGLPVPQRREMPAQTSTVPETSFPEPEVNEQAGPGQESAWTLDEVSVTTLDATATTTTTEVESAPSAAYGYQNRKSFEPSSSYTLQLFALSNSENVQKVLDTYPQLDLRVISGANGARPHRIVFGSFAAEADAAAAYLDLPADLTRGQPTPVIKSSAELSP